MTELDSNCATCHDYGPLFCRICFLYYCHEHKCSHLPSFDISFSNIEEASESMEEFYEPIDTEVGVLSLPTPLLKVRQDKLFKELKSIQRELESRFHLEHPFEYKAQGKYRTKSNPKPKAQLPDPRLKQIAPFIEFLKAQGKLEAWVAKVKENNENRRQIHIP